MKFNKKNLTDCKNLLFSRVEPNSAGVIHEPCFTVAFIVLVHEGVIHQNPTKV